MWWAAALSRRDCELACDEGAIRRLGEADRFAYGRTLLDMVSASHVGLLQTATAMSDSNSQLRTRIALIAKHPQTRAAAALAVVAAVVLAVVSTFTGGKNASLQDQLYDLPEEFAETVVLEKRDSLPEGTMLTAYYAPDYDSEYGGWLFHLYEWDQADFERHLCAVDASGMFCFARSEDHYYAILLPTDVNFTPGNAEAYHAVQSAFSRWVREAVLAREDMEPFTEDDVAAIRRQPFTYEGNHIDTAYYPYYAVNGSRDVVWTFRLSQPVTQGDDGIWCVERYLLSSGDGYDTFLNRPDTDLPAREYYRQLQKQADSGQADWALDPMEVCLRMAYSFDGGHLNATAASFDLGEIYSSVPGSANGQAAAILEDLRRSQYGVTVELDLASHGGRTTRSLAGDDPELLDLLTGLTEEFRWVDAHDDTPLATNPWGDENLDYFFYLHNADHSIGLSCYADSPWVSYTAPGKPRTNFYVLSPEGEPSIAAYIKAWFDGGAETPVFSVDGLGELPDDLRDQVGVKTDAMTNFTGEPFPEGTVASFYDWKLNLASSYIGPEHSMGWLCDLFHITPELLETELPNDGVWEIIAEDGDGGYYAVLSAAGAAAEQKALQEALRTWLTETVAELPGAEPASIYKVYPDLGLSGAAKTAESALRHIMAGDTVVMEMTCVDGVGGGRYTRDPSKANGPNRQIYFTVSFDWSYTDSGLPPSPEPARALRIASADEAYALDFWQDSDKVRYTSPGGTVWLCAVSNSDPGDVFDCGVFQFMRFWYDEAEIDGLIGDVVIPDRGQSHQEIAQEWVDTTQGAKLRATTGSKYACTYVRNVVKLWEDTYEGWYQDYMLETDHFYFGYTQIFVPENKTAVNWMMAGNTGDYTGEYGEAPAGAFMRAQMGPMYLAEDGWRCDGTGTGP